MEKEIRVWDPLVRIFHWSMMLFFAVAYLSGEEESDIHIYSGYLILGLLVFRLLWGFVGTWYARFSNFVYSPETIIDYIKAMLAGHSKRYIGHNPAGGAMIVVLLLSLVVVTYSGLKVYAIEEGAGPLAMPATELGFIQSAHADDDDEDEHEHEYSYEAEHEDEEEEFWEEIHEASANFVLLLVMLHIGGVIVSGRLHNENLVKAMITGRKRAE